MFLLICYNTNLHIAATGCVKYMCYRQNTCRNFKHHFHKYVLPKEQVNLGVFHKSGVLPKADYIYISVHTA